MAGRTRAGVWSPPLVVAVALPVLFIVVIAVIAIVARSGGFTEAPVAETGPLSVAPVDAPAAAGPECAGLLAALPSALGGTDAPLPGREITPVVPGARAWAAAPRPVVLRCGLPRPAELVPTSPLLQVNGVAWLTLDDGVPDPVVVTQVAVDRSVFVVVTVPVDAGPGPLQEISDIVRERLPEQRIPVR